MGSVVAGTVTGITKFGAFVTIVPGKSGLVHISEIADAFVSDVKDHLAEGQEVTVKIIGVDKSGRLNLSIKAASNVASSSVGSSSAVDESSPSKKPDKNAGIRENASSPSFEDKLKRFIQDSDSKMSGLKQYSDKKSARRRGR